MRFAIIGWLLAFTASGFACEYPDEGRTPLRRAVTRIEMLPEVVAWAREKLNQGVKPQYVVRLDEPLRASGRCYWPVEVRAAGKLWRRYFITPDGKNIRVRE